MLANAPFWEDGFDFFETLSAGSTIRWHKNAWKAFNPLTDVLCKLRRMLHSTQMQDQWANKAYCTWSPNDLESLISDLKLIARTDIVDAGNDNNNYTVCSMRVQTKMRTTCRTLRLLWLSSQQAEFLSAKPSALETVVWIFDFGVKFYTAAVRNWSKTATSAATDFTCYRAQENSNKTEITLKGKTVNVKKIESVLSGFTITHISSKLHQFLSSSFSVSVQAYTHTWTDAARSNTPLHRFTSMQSDENPTQIHVLLLIIQCLWCCYRGTSDARVHATHLMNAETTSFILLTINSLMLNYRRW